MSRFIDKLNQASQTSPQPVGFKVSSAVSSAVSSKPKMVLVASLVSADVENPTDYVSGADAGLIPVSKPRSAARIFQQVSQAVPDVPWGGWLGGSGTADVGSLAKAGCDFVVFAAATAMLSMGQKDEVGRVLQVEASLGDGLLAAVNELPVDAVLVGGEKGGALTWHDLMLARRCAALSTKPLLFTVPSKVAGDELKALWEVGVRGVIVVVEQPVGGVNDLRQFIDKTDFPWSRRRGGAQALLPRVSPAAPAVAEEEEEEE